MQESDYWNRFWRRRISRRGLLSSAAIAGSGLAAAAVFGCSGASTNAPNSASKAANRSPGIRPLAALDAAAETPGDGRRIFTPAPADSRGGTLRYPGFDAVVLDRYDPHQTQFGPMYSNLSAVFSKLYMYKSHEEPTWENIQPDLAASQPETPDQLTYIVHLRKGVKFHNTEKARKSFPNVAGRELTADDVIFSYLRQANPNSPQRPYYYRSDQYDTIDKMEKVDDYTVKITTKEPVVAFRHFMADTNAMIIPKEIVDQAQDTVDVTNGPKPEDRMIGTGPFTWGTLQWGIQFQGLRNADWFGWDDQSLGRPYIDGYSATGQGLNDATVEALFRQKKVDVASYIDNPSWIIDIKNEFPGIIYQADRISGWVNTRFKSYCKPFDDWRVRRAMHLAIDRQEVIDVMGAGQWFLAGPVNGAIKYWALPDDQLEALPGYRRGSDRDKDIQEARQLYEAAGKPAIPQAWFADIPAYITAYAPTYVETMKKNLDVKISTLTQSYGRIAEGLVKQDCQLGSFTFGYDNGWIDLDDWVFPYFRSKASKNSFQVSDPALDTMLDAQRHEFDWNKRKQLGYDIQRYLLGQTKQDAPAALLRLDYASPGGGFIAWPYLKNRTTWPWFGNNYWYSQLWFDKKDASYQGRPA